MNLEFFILGGYGPFIWSAFIFTFASCFILFLVCTATVEKNDISLGQVLAIIGWSFLCIQTVFWDGILWVLKFHPDRTSLA